MNVKECLKKKKNLVVTVDMDLKKKTELLLPDHIVLLSCSLWTP